MIKIGSVTLPTFAIQSPMAGCTDLAFRLIARRRGLRFAFLEMVSAEALARENKKTLFLMKVGEGDRPLGAQIVGCDPDAMAEAAVKIEAMGYDVLDLNLGCPVSKVVSPGGGSALLVRPETCRVIFKAIVRRVKKIPVTVKMRKGFSDKSGQEAVTIAKIAEDEGIAAVTVHGRTRSQGYQGEADWDSIGKVRQAVKIPVIGNGDVQSADDAKRLMKRSGCAGIMIGRGGLGNPWLYREVDALLGGQSVPEPPSFEEVRETALEHFEAEIETEGAKTGLLKCRRILCWYFKKVPGVSEFRRAINQCDHVDEMRKLIQRFGSSKASHASESL